MSDYQAYSARFVQLGLNLRDAPDKVGEGYWTRLHNVRSTQEAQLQAREGMQSFVVTGSGSPVHSLRRMGDSTLLVGSGTNLYRNATMFATGGYSGNPLGIVPYRPAISSASWSFIGDSNQMRKVRDDGTDYKWGVTAPTVAAVFGAGAAGNLDSSVSGGTVYDWRYTYYSTTTGAESNGSPTVGGIAVVSQVGDVTVVASADAQIDQIKIYRRGGTLVDWHLTLTVANASGTYIDNNADSSIAAAVVLRTNRYVPFTSKDASGNTVYEANLPYVWGPFVGKYILACGSSGEPGHAFWTNAELPDESDTSNKVEVTAPHEPLQNGFIYSSTPFVWSRDDLYVLDFGSATAVTFVPRKTACGRGLSAPWAFCVGPSVWFLSDDGIYETDGSGPATSITEESLRPLFRGIAVSDLQPIDYSQTTSLRMSYGDNEVRFFYQDTNGTFRQLVYHTIYRRWKSADSPTTSIRMGYMDENVAQARILLGAGNGTVYRVDPTVSTDVGAAPAVAARTGSWDMSLPTTLKEYGNVLIDADPQGSTITVTPLVNTEATALNAAVLSGNGRQKFAISLTDTRAYNIAFDFAWATSAGIIYQLDVLWRQEEEAIQHWEFITTHGLIGWQHVRDAYFSLISTSDVTFTHNIDGVDYTYTIPSTGGVRLKRYVPLQPRKGKVFTYTLDAATDFRLFGNECEVRVKPWITSLGYQLTTPFSSPAPEA